MIARSDRSEAKGLPLAVVKPIRSRGAIDSGL
jgi:hypothetical protein